MPHIRIHNSTGADLDVVRIYVPAEPREAVDFGPVPNGAYSEYESVAVAYRFAEVEASGPAGSFSLRPYDYVGEQPLPMGWYTYRLGIAEGRLTLDLEGATPEDQ
jgi:hypothetical protein